MSAVSDRSEQPTREVTRRPRLLVVDDQPFNVRILQQLFAEDLTASLDFARAIERRIRALGIAHEDSEVAPVVTVSLGAATSVPGSTDDVASLLARADAQLYMAKRNGRGHARAGP